MLGGLVEAAKQGCAQCTQMPPRFAPLVPATHSLRPTPMVCIAVARKRSPYQLLNHN